MRVDLRALSTFSGNNKKDSFLNHVPPVDHCRSGLLLSGGFVRADQSGEPAGVEPGFFQAAAAQPTYGGEFYGLDRGARCAPNLLPARSSTGRRSADDMPRMPKLGLSLE